MPRRCFVPNCRSGYNPIRNEVAKKVSLFQAPKDPDLLEKWRRAIPRKDRVLGRGDHVCELHFDNRYVSKFFDKEETLQREIPKLDGAAVPTRFPDCPSYLSKKLPPERNRSRGKTHITAKKKDAAKTVGGSNHSSVGEGCSGKVVLERTKSSGTKPIDNTPMPKQATEGLDLRDVVEELAPEGTPNADHNNTSQATTDASESPIANEGDTEVSFFECLIQECLPERYRESWSKMIFPDVIRYLYWPRDEKLCKKYVEIDKNLYAKVMFGEVTTIFYGYKKIPSLNSLNELLETIQSTPICESAMKNAVRKCRGFSNNDARNKHCGKIFCGNCIIRVKRIADSEPRKLRFKNKCMKRKMKRLNKKIITLQQKLVVAQAQCAKLEEESIFEKLEDLDSDENLKESIRNCINVAKAASKNGIRYSQKWLFECILLKIKSTQAYTHIISHGIMPLPHPCTINRYLRQLKPSYGFQSGVFEMLSSKAGEMNNWEKEGCILVDEMNLRETYSFDKNDTMKVLGFTDLGNHTPEAQKEQLGNHALVLMYQPFSGSWIQPIGCFLSRGAAASDVLYQIILESVILLENSGLRISAITSDGAQWNRSMWAEFGVSEEKVCCEHPCDPERNLWFLSDFPHLIKNLRNWILRMKVFKTPDGKVKVAHWEELLKAESNRYKLRAAFKLTETHLKPTNFEKMNVGLAFQIFDDTVADAMELYKDEEEHKEVLRDSESTVAFIRRIGGLIKSMSSRTPKGALRGGSIDSVERKTIEEFIDYLDEWENMHPVLVPVKKKKPVVKKIVVKKTVGKKKITNKIASQEKGTTAARKKKAVVKTSSKGKKRKTASGEEKPRAKKIRPGFITLNTCVGLKVTLRSTLQLLEYLTKERGFLYLMTARLNQDNLEKFFGMIRAAGGNNDHPDSARFPYLYRLISAYSLLKPPKGSNVSNEEAFSTFAHLMSSNHILGKEKEKQISLAQDIWSLVGELEEQVDEGSGDSDELSHAERCIIESFAGYVARKGVRRLTNCKHCAESLTGDREQSGKLLSTRDKYGVLFVPSTGVFELITYLEKKVTNEIDGKIENVTRDTFFNICKKINQLDLSRNSMAIGCIDHSEELVSKLVHFYITTRLFFIVREAKKQLKTHGKCKALKKQSKCTN